MNEGGPKTCIIGIGGATRSARSAGLLWEAGVALGTRRPNLVVGSSGASGNVVYASTEQYDVLPRIWTEEIPTKHFFDPFRIPMMSIDYLVHEVLGKKHPLDRAKLGEYSIATRIADTKETRYGTEQDDVDPLLMLKASKAMPVVYGKKIPLPWGECVDGQIGCTAQTHVDHALHRGATDIILIDDSKTTTQEKRWKVEVPPTVRLLHFPPRHLPVKGVAGNSVQEMKDALDVGIEEAREYRDALREILGEKSKRERGITSVALPRELPIQAEGAALMNVKPEATLR